MDEDYDLILLGQGPSMEGCPFDTETWAAVSVLSHKEFEDKPYSRLFCFDKPDTKFDEAVGLDIALARGIPVIGLGVGVFVTEEYPLKDIIKRFNTLYFFNDMSYMIALALHLGYKSLMLWGVDQGPQRMYEGALPFVTHWLGVATGMGVKWDFCPASRLRKALKLNWLERYRKTGELSNE